MAAIARQLDERKKRLAHGEFEKWAVRAYPRYSIQVLRYLRKAHRVFGEELKPLLERHGQKKVFLLVGLDDPWGPVRDGIAGTALTELSVRELRAAVRQARAGQAPHGRAGGWSGVAIAIERWAAVWPRLKSMRLDVVVERTSGARQQLERFRATLREAVGHLDEVLAPRPARRPSSPFLD